MKVILLRDVAKIGRRHTVVEVPDGFALNRLIPKKDALPATPANLKSLREKLGQAEASVAYSLEQASGLAAKLSELKIEIYLKANPQGHLYEALSVGEVVKAAANHGLVIDQAMVVVPSHHKETGACEVSLRVQGKNYPFTVNIIPQQ